MSNKRAACRARVVLVLVALSIAGGAGCLPHTVAWLPDSSGFMNQGDEQGTYIHFDLARARRSTVMAKTGVTTPAPAVSPDGKRIAVRGGQSSW